MYHLGGVSVRKPSSHIIIQGFLQRMLSIVDQSRSETQSVAAFLMRIAEPTHYAVSFAQLGPKVLIYVNWIVR